MIKDYIGDKPCEVKEIYAPKISMHQTSINQINISNGYIDEGVHPVTFSHIN